MSETVLELEGNLRTGDAATLRVRLLAALASGDVVVRMSAVVSVDAAIVQVLLSARQSARHMDRNLQIEDARTGALGAMAGRLALADALAA